MKRRRQQQGIALITTLIMLAVVTLMAVAFLAVSRRERAAVSTTSDRLDAKSMAETAEQRAEAEVLSRVIANTNILSYEFLVSTNYFSPAGFVPGNANIANVNYRYANGAAVSGNDLLQLYRNLQIDPRPPVYVVTNNAVGNPAGQEFRYYLDFNRNGFFETNGFQVEITRSERPGGTNYHVGDPEWIGVLRRPDLPHSGSNLFVGRFAYLILPVGKSLDLNFVHNHAKRTVPVSEGFYRNQGIGSWEINLAAFLRDLNTNAWNTYAFVPGNVFAPNQGIAFENAFDLLQFRYNGDYRNLTNVSALFGANGVKAFRNDGIDGYSDGQLQTGLDRPYTGTAPSFVIPDDDDPTRPWPGADNPAQYFDPQELFSVHKATATAVDQFTNRLMVASLANSTYDRHTFYRLLGQLGTDSVNNNRGKINLNYDNRLDFNTNLAGRTPRADIGWHATNFVPWTALAFFTNAADRILKTLHPPPTNGLPLIAVTNIQVWPTNYYSPAVHRSLQLAANIFDATTNRGQTYPYFPTVFRPLFGIDPSVAGGLRITNYVDATADANGFWRNVTNNSVINNPNNHSIGLPVIIGAKKGFPNFNEFDMQTVAVASRKLELVKLSPSSPPTITNQMYTLGISNIVGVEFWNSYEVPYPRNLELRVRLETSMVLSNELGVIRRYVTNMTATRALTPNQWAARQFQLPIHTNLLFLPMSVYSAQRRVFLTNILGSLGLNAFESAVGFPVPVWRLSVTNRLQAALIDTSPEGGPGGRLVDYVDLANLNSQLDIALAFQGQTQITTGRNAPVGSFWRTNRFRGMPEGVRNQVLASEGSLAADNWVSLQTDPSVGDKQKAIERFRHFLGFPGEQEPIPATLRMQVPLSPGVKIVDHKKWQVNDPLVNDMIWDVTDPARTNAPPEALPPLEVVTDDRSNLGKVNQRYRPWQRDLNSSANATEDFNIGLKDPQITRSEDWDFPTNVLPSIGWLGRIHRGTPWQTIYLKSKAVENKQWTTWSGHPFWLWPLGVIPLTTHPTNDWLLLDLFTTAPSDNATRGQLSVNQDGLAAWSAVLSDVPIFTNSVASTNFSASFIQPNTAELRTLVAGINAMRVQRFGQKFNNLGEILSTPELTLKSPYLQVSESLYGTPPDAVVERIPQMVLSLLKRDDPRFVVLAYGQSLRPAPGSVVTEPGIFFQMPTNYVITGEFVTKTLMHLEPFKDPVTGVTRYKPVKETYNEIPPTE